MASTKELQGSARSKAFFSIAIGLLLVIMPLAATTFKAASEDLNERAAHQTALYWLEASDYEVNEVHANGREVEVIITGSGDLPQLRDLSPELQAELQNYDMEIKVIPAQTLHFGAAELD